MLLVYVELDTRENMKSVNVKLLYLSFSCRKVLICNIRFAWSITETKSRSLPFPTAVFDSKGKTVVQHSTLVLEKETLNND